VLLPASVDEPSEEHASPEHALAHAELLAHVRASINSLPEAERTLLNRHYFGDVTMDEAAREIGLSKSWASRLHARALEAVTRDLRRNRIIR
jgi:RNA polymerase sigma factor FliA